MIKLHNKELNIAPLSGGYMITSIVGFLISVYIIPKSGIPNAETWSFTFVLFFTLMFIASLISMTYAPSDWPLKMDMSETQRVSEHARKSSIFDRKKI